MLKSFKASDHFALDEIRIIKLVMEPLKGREYWQWLKLYDQKKKLIHIEYNQKGVAHGKEQN